MLFRRIMAPRKYPNFDASLITSGTSVKNSGSFFLKMRAMAMKTVPINTDVVRTTTTENFAALGRFAPSSFDTRTLMQETRDFSLLVNHLLGEIKRLEMDCYLTAI